MARTTATAVEKVLGNDYGPKFDGTSPSLVPYVDTASLYMDQVVACMIRKGYAYSTAQLEMIERWLAAWLYTKMDPTYASRSTAGASASFVRGKEEPESYKDVATSLDGSGCLSALLNRTRASLTWLGKVPSDQIDYENRR